MFQIKFTLLLLKEKAYESKDPGKLIK